MEVDFNTSYIGPCPRSRDIKKYTDVLNSLSLIGGVKIYHYKFIDYRTTVKDLLHPKPHL